MEDYIIRSQNNLNKLIAGTATKDDKDSIICDFLGIGHFTPEQYVCCTLDIGDIEDATEEIKIFKELLDSYLN